MRQSYTGQLASSLTSSDGAAFHSTNLITFTLSEWRKLPKLDSFVGKKYTEIDIVSVLVFWSWQMNKLVPLHINNICQQWQKPLNFTRLTRLQFPWLTASIWATSTVLYSTLRRQLWVQILSTRVVCLTMNRWHKSDIHFSITKCWTKQDVTFRSQKILEGVEWLKLKPSILTT